MKYFALIPMGCCFVLGFIFFSLLFSKHQSALKKRFLSILGISFIWNFLTLIEWWPDQSAETGYNMIYLKIFAINILYSQSIYFFYLLLQKKRKLIFWIMQALFMLAVLANLVLPPLGYPLLTRVTTAAWGYLPQFNPVYLYSYIPFGIFIIIHASFLIFTTYRHNPHEIIKRQLRLVGIGIILSAFCFLFVSMLLSMILKIESLPVLNSTFSIIAAIFGFIAISRYQFLSPGMLSEANIIFAHLNDSVIILDHAGKIVSVNQSARQLFHIKGTSLKELSSEVLIGNGFTLKEEYLDAPITFEPDKRFLLSQFPLIKMGILRGYMIFLKDVTHLTETEARIRELNTILTARAEASDEELQKANYKILQQQYKEELAKLTTLTLHNVRNVMSTIKTSSELLMTYFTSTPVLGLKKANALLQANMDNPEHFLLEDPKGKLLLQYYLKLDESLEKEKKKAFEHFDRLEKGIHNADQIIAIQQGYGQMDRQVKIAPQEIIEDALNILSGTLRIKKIDVKKNYELLPLIKLQKAKFIHILLPEKATSFGGGHS